jgi:predicted TIM-barrel fold metal-dependent hydrolase
MEKLAAQPNVVSKLSAFGTFVHHNDPKLIADIVQETVAMFGSRRCLFGSNFPIEKLWTDYGSLLRAHLDAARSLDTGAQDDIFWNTATRVYKLAD